MFKSSFLFELRYRLTSIGTWVCFLALFLMAYREMLAGEWDVLIQSGRVARNAPYTVYYLFMYYTFWAATVGSALMLPTLLRDLKSGSAELLYSYPINSKSYFLGKYLASMLIFILVMSSVAAAFITMPWVTTTLGTHDPADYIATPWAHIGHAFLIWVLPACFVYGSLTIALTAITGRNGPVYAMMMLAVGLFVMITAIYGDGAPQSTLVQVLDPLGKVTVEGQIYYWTAEERMQRFLSLEGALLQNRLLYIGLAAVFLILALWRFDLRKLLERAKHRGAKQTKEPIQDADTPAVFLAPRSIHFDTLTAANWHYWLQHALISGYQAFAIIFKNKAFYLSMLTLIAMLVLAGFSYESTDFEGTGKLLPKVFILMPALIYPSLIFTLVAAAFFSIELFDRERNYRLNQLVESCPVPTWSLFLTKLIGAVLMAATLALIPGLSVLIIQFGQGFFDTNWLMMGHITFLVLLPLMLAYVLIALFSYALFQNKALAQAVAIIICITPAIFNELKTVENFMLLWAWPFFVQLSDFDASGQFLQRNLRFSVYWLSLYAALIMIAYWLWPRGTAAPFAIRLKQSANRLGTVSVSLALLFTGIFGWSAFSIHRDMVVNNNYQSSQQAQADQADYEKKYGPTRRVLQPKIVFADLKVDLYPADRQAKYAADLTLMNLYTTPIEALTLNYAEFTQILLATYDEQPLQATQHDLTHRRLVYPLPSPLRPGEQATLNLQLDATYHNFSNAEFDYHGTIVLDGSYFAHTMWPTFGYIRDRELTTAGLRKIYQLGERQPLPSHDKAALVSALIDSDDANLINSRIQISTAVNQRALTPGTAAFDNGTACQVKAQRQVCMYENRQVTPWHLPMVSGRYQLTSASWQPDNGDPPVQIEIYAHPAHHYNVQRMIDAAKLALSAGTEQWGTFPYQQLRIAEIPNGMAETQVSGNLVIIPEKQAWLNDKRPSATSDWITYQITRDISRIWWQQIAVAALQGHQLITQAIPAVEGLRALEHKFGQPASTDFIDQISDAYLRQRTTEDQQEAAVRYLDDEAYANHKATLSLFSAYKLLGQDAYHQLLKRFYSSHRQLSSAPFTNSGALVKQLLSQAKAAQRKQLDPLFHDSRFYDFQIEQTDISPRNQGRYRVQATFSATQYRYLNGKDVAAEYNGFVRVQITSQKPNSPLLFDQLVQFEHGRAFINIELEYEPAAILINPDRQLLERSPSNNARPL
ncbi:membrane protein, putative [Methylophaga frappieri]|uniref:Membrane protein, putative n=1 Tax=Methylophaga frappieri (strain ATCC BAA-2434 / DSM 25690 / JAM7) TaxID=754477 RepID=I1YF75_METFJ|nr:ABC-2 transporter permease [Methylophaga frappieri]AFJ01568.1 membrane protein, putative [Methylophaga frappieri]